MGPWILLDSRLDGIYPTEKFGRSVTSPTELDGSGNPRRVVIIDWLSATLPFQNIDYIAIDLLVEHFFSCLTERLAGVRAISFLEPLNVPHMAMSSHLGQAT